MMDLQLQERKKELNIQEKLWCGFTSEIIWVKLFIQGNSFQAGFVCRLLSGAELVLRPIFNIIPFHKKELNEIFFPMLLFSFQTFPYKFRIQGWSAAIPCLTECRKCPSGKKMDPCTIPALLFSRLSWCRRIHSGS